MNSMLSRVRAAAQTMATSPQPATARTAIIDIGSNSVRLVVYDGPRRLPFILFNEKVMAGLGASLARTGRIEEEPMERGLRAIGLLAWLWIVVQALGGGAGDGDVASLFLWVYGWVGLALLSALIGPDWAWLDPFSTIHAGLSWLAGRLGLSGGENAVYPERLGRWPAVIGFAVVVWLELVGRVEGGRSLGVFLVGYTVLTVAAMSYFGRDAWRAKGETFSVWFGLLGRLAPFALEGSPEDGTVRRRPYASGLLSETWSTADLVLIALGTGSIIFDGLSQTRAVTLTSSTKIIKMSAAAQAWLCQSS